MTVGAGLLIEAADYNAIRAKVNAVMGVGSGSSGYGQALYANGDVSSTQLITADQLRNLQKDVIRARLHQVGSGLTGLVAANPVATSAGLVQATHFSTLDSDATLINTDKLSAHSSQLSLEPLLTGTRNTAWTTVVTHTVTVTFGGYTTPIVSPNPNNALTVSAANHARAFFNAGGKIAFSATRTGGSATLKNTYWTNLLNAMGEIQFNYTTTVSTNSSGTAQPIGWYDLTTSNQLIYRKNHSGYGYSYSGYNANSYRIYARRDAGSTQAIFTIEFRDDDTNDVDSVNGTLNSYVNMYRPSSGSITLGAYSITGVSVTAPTASQSGM